MRITNLAETTCESNPRNECVNANTSCTDPNISSACSEVEDYNDLLKSLGISDNDVIDMMSRGICFNQEENTESLEILDSTTNYRFTPTVAGYYQINAQIALNFGYGSLQGYIYKNGSAYVQFGDAGDRTENFSKSISVSDLIYFNGTSDYIELYGQGEKQTAFGRTRTFMSGFLARSA